MEKEAIAYTCIKNRFYSALANTNTGVTKKLAIKQIPLPLARIPKKTDWSRHAGF